MHIRIAERDQEMPTPEALEDLPKEPVEKKARTEADQLEEIVEIGRLDLACMAAMTDKKFVEIGVPCESLAAFLQEPAVWLSKRLGDGKTAEVSYHKLDTLSRPLFGEAMSRELSQVLISDDLRRVEAEQRPHI